MSQEKVAMKPETIVLHHVDREGEKKGSNVECHSLGDRGGLESQWQNRIRNGQDYQVGVSKRPEGPKRKPVSTWRSLHVIGTRVVVSKATRQPLLQCWSSEMREPGLQFYGDVQSRNIDDSVAKAHCSKF
jgi:hypothetical protein